MKTLVCTNVLDSVRSLVYGSHAAEWFRMGRNTSDEFILFHPERFSIDNARTQAARYALEMECDYIYFLDDDMVLSYNTYLSLRQCEADVTMALTFIRGYPFDVMAFRYERDERNKGKKLIHFNDYKNHIEFDGIAECDAVGFACTLIKTEHLLTIPPPYFVTGSHQTEDIYYCLKLKQHVPLSRIVVDTKVPTGHLLGQEFIHVHTRDKLLEYFKPESEEKNSDRGKEYRDKNIMPFINEVKRFSQNG